MTGRRPIGNVGEAGGVDIIGLQAHPGLVLLMPTTSTAWYQPPPGAPGSSPAASIWEAI